MSLSDPTADAKAKRKAKRIERALHNQSINSALEDIDKNLHEIVETTANELGIDIDEIRSQFLAYASIRSASRPTAWNGLIHEKAIEWSEEKENYPGGSYMHYVVERIRDEGLYEQMGEEEKEYYIQAAQRARDAKLNAGSSRTTAKRLVQGTAKDKLEEIAAALTHLHNVTSIEFALIAVRGQSTDGLKPRYFASSTAEAFLESHLSVSMDQLVTLMESASLGGASALLNSAKTESSHSKTLIRQIMLEALRDAAVSPAANDTPPIIANRQDIPFVEWSNQQKMVRSYNVVSFGWPLRDSARMVLPNGMGLGTLNQYLQLIKLNKCGFKRLTKDETESWLSQFDEDVKAGKIELEGRKTRSDAGQSKGKKTQTMGGANEAHKMANSEINSNLEATKSMHNVPPASGVLCIPSLHPPTQAASHSDQEPSLNSWDDLDSEPSPVSGFDGINTTSDPAIPIPPAPPSPQPSYPAGLRFRHETAEKILSRSQRSASRSRSRSRTPIPTATAESHESPLGASHLGHPTTPLGLHNAPFERLLDPNLPKSNLELSDDNPRRSKRLRK